MPLSFDWRAARRTFTDNPPAALSAAASASAPGVPPSTMVSGLPSIALASAVMNSAPRSISTPSDSQTHSASGAAATTRAIAGSASMRSTVCGFGLIWRSCTRAAPGVCISVLRPPSDIGRIVTARLSFSARARMSSPVRMRASQLAAADQPSSISSTSALAPLDVATGGFHSGPAAAMMTNAVRPSRKAVSHQGVRAGVSSFGTMSKSSRAGGKLSLRGRGGMSRNSHHSTGRLSRPSRTSGCAKPMGRPPIMPRSLFGTCARHAVAGVVAFTHARMQRQHEFARRPVGAMDDEAPAEMIGFGADLGTMALEPLHIIVAPGFGAAGGDAARAFRIEKLDAAVIRERLFRRIDDLQHMAMRARAGELRDLFLHLGRSATRNPRASRLPTAARARSSAAGWRARRCRE